MLRTAGVAVEAPPRRFKRGQQRCRGSPGLRRSGRSTDPSRASEKPGCDSSSCPTRLRAVCPAPLADRSADRGLKQFGHDPPPSGVLHGDARSTRHRACLLPNIPGPPPGTWMFARGISTTGGNPHGSTLGQGIGRWPSRSRATRNGAAWQGDGRSRLAGGQLTAAGLRPCTSPRCARCETAAQPGGASCARSRIDRTAPPAAAGSSQKCTPASPRGGRAVVAADFGGSLGLGIPRLVLRGTARLKDEDHAPRFGRVRRLAQALVASSRSKSPRPNPNSDSPPASSN